MRGLEEILSSPSDVNEKNFELDLDVDDSQIESKEKNEDIINFIKDLNADEISPKDALDILYTLKKILLINMNKDLLEKDKIDKFKDIFIKKKDHLRKEFYKHHKAIKTCKNISETSDEFLKELFGCFAKKIKRSQDQLVYVQLVGMEENN